MRIPERQSCVPVCLHRALWNRDTQWPRRTRPLLSTRAVGEPRLENPITKLGRPETDSQGSANTPTLQGGPRSTSSAHAPSCPATVSLPASITSRRSRSTRRLSNASNEEASDQNHQAGAKQSAGNGPCRQEEPAKTLHRACMQTPPDSCDPLDCSLPGSSVRGILQARILQWVAIPFSGDLPNPEMEPRSPTLQVDSLPSESPGKPP